MGRDIYVMGEPEVPGVFFQEEFFSVQEDEGNYQEAEGEYGANSDEDVSSANPIAILTENLTVKSL